MINIRTPLLVDTSTNFELYINRLSKTDQKKYKANQKECMSFSFSEIEYDPTLMHSFISLWVRQKVYGKSIRWYRPIEAMDLIDTIRMFKIEKNNEVVAIHFVELFGDFAYAQPVLYDKARTPEVARFAWFNTIKWCTENAIKYLDLDGGSGRDWQSLVRDRHLNKENDALLQKISYKWFYVPEDVKNNPDKELPYLEFRCECGWKSLFKTGDKIRCDGHSRQSRRFFYCP
jgi:hypothetical protein